MEILGQGVGGEHFGLEVLVGTCPAVERMRLQVARFAPHFRTMLLSGEAGTGKRTLAVELGRMAGAAMLWGCAVSDFVDGSAHAGGMLYLHGLESAGLVTQERLLARLDTLGREVRVIVGLAADPRGMVAAGRLQSDVLERIGTLEIRLPSLRERADDLEVMTAAMLSRLKCPETLTGEHLASMRQGRWAGNLPELWAACVAFAESGEMNVAMTNADAHHPVRLEEAMRRHVVGVLERCAGNKLRAAEMLGISRSTLYRMLEAD